MRQAFYDVFLSFVCWQFILTTRTTTTTTAFLIDNNSISRPSSFVSSSSSSWSSKSLLKSTKPSKSTTPRSTSILFAEKNRPWNVIQFVQQSSKFVNIFPSSKTTASKKIKIEGDEGRLAKRVPKTVLWKAGDTSNNDFEFSPLDDVVMGGASYSTYDKGTGKWKGTVTDANNGGFVGIRSTPYVDYDLSACKGIEWTVLARTPIDMIRLKIVLQDTTDFNGVGWTTSMDTTKSPNPLLSTFKIPFSSGTLKPSRFAKILTEKENKNKPFNSSSIKAFQLTYSKFEFDGNLNPRFYLGDFEIQLMAISTY